ncbi:MAG TPA: undecaprenyl-phosphate glucose phosphotransferase [Chitinophaga sp.]|uniref:undecaprenyl-phosphate glucose phosphotransferase n=1 Tax=Chitinophaga sp. TaxID=1869181 RepID=UPI002BBC6E2B|nr:undecaprenyl-phosphate glucose phosphotransferase [Chitinophaga sp.]HVI44783.1 undecaprenyl-phosphate glucose phosphotransferase [Chitinophaga sp.]
MKNNIRASLLLRQSSDYVMLLLAFLCAREYIHGKGDVFMSGFNFLLLLISFFTWAVSSMAVHLVEDFRLRSFSFEFIAILKASLIHACVFSFLFFYCFKYYPFPRTFTCLYTTLLFVMITTCRFIIKRILIRMRSSGYNTRNVVIIGAGETGMNFYREISSNEQFGYRCVGFVDDHHAKVGIGKQYLGDISSLKSILETHEVDDVIVALPGTQTEQTARVIMASEQEAKRVRIIADCHRFCTSTTGMHVFGHFPLITIRSSPLDDVTRQAFKRFFDICITVILLVTVFTWLFPIIAILIKLTSRGPVFFRQERWGVSNKRIMCYKFRSMKTESRDTDNDGRYLQAMKFDKRITPLGSFLRRTSLDELPQFINVLMGDMSIVGPRPHPLPLHYESKSTVENYMLRHMVKPGITGWAQVNGCRGETRQLGQMQKRVNLDLWYIEHYTFWLDIQIIFQTVMNMVKGDRNAY